MENSVLRMDALISVKINEHELGMVQSYRRRRKTELIPVYAIGESRPTAFLPGTTYYAVTLSQLRPGCALLVQDLVDHSLRDFTLTIVENGFTFVYIGCEIVSVACGCDGSGMLIEEMEVHCRAYQEL